MSRKTAGWQLGVSYFFTFINAINAVHAAATSHFVFALVFASLGLATLYTGELVYFDQIGRNNG